MGFTFESINQGIYEDCFKFFIENQKNWKQKCELKEIQIVGQPMETEILTAEFYFKCDNHIHKESDDWNRESHSLTIGSFYYQWFRCPRNSTFIKIEGANLKVLNIKIL
jgi:hypothetical protein